MTAFDRWYLRDAPPERIAVLRILVGLFALIYTSVRLPDLWGYSDFSDSRFRPVGVTGVLDLPLSPTVWHALLIGTIALSVAFTVGWKYRMVAPVFAVALLFETTYHDSFGQLFHTENLMVLFVIVLAVTPAADAYAVDRRATLVRPGPQYGWPLVLLSVITVTTYVLAGWAKIANGGMGWLDGDVLLNQIAFDNARKAVMGDPYSAIGAWMVGHAWLFPPIAVAAVLVELAAPVALLGGRWRNVWVVAAWLFHAGTAAVMYISFPFPLFGIAFAPFYEIERIPVWLAAHAPARFRPATT